MTDDEPLGESPYREVPRFLMCPRCAEVLEGAFEGVMSCLRCNGVWIMQPTIDTAFGDPRWPLGASAWWHRALECPECGVDGTPKVMDASIVGEVIVDRCRGHGVWLDHGELARVLGLPSGVSELIALQRLVAPSSAVDPSARLAARGRDREAMRRSAQAARELEARHRAEREEARVQAQEREARELRRIEEHAARLKELAAADAKLEQTREERRRALVAERVAEVNKVRTLEDAIVGLRTALQTAGINLEARREAISAIDAALATLEAER